MSSNELQRHLVAMVALDQRLAVLSKKQQWSKLERLAERQMQQFRQFFDLVESQHHLLTASDYQTLKKINSRHHAILHQLQALQSNSVKDKKSARMQCIVSHTYSE